MAAEVPPEGAITPARDLLRQAIQAVVRDVEPQWLQLGLLCRQVWPTPEKMAEEGAIIKRWIIQALSEREQELLSKPLPRKAITAREDEATKLLKKERAKAQSKVSKYWSRLLDYAFPQERVAKPGDLVPQNSMGGAFTRGEMDGSVLLAMLRKYTTLLINDIRLEPILMDLRFAMGWHTGCLPVLPLILELMEIIASMIPEGAPAELLKFQDDLVSIRERINTGVFGHPHAEEGKLQLFAQLHALYFIRVRGWLAAGDFSGHHTLGNTIRRFLRRLQVYLFDDDSDKVLHPPEVPRAAGAR